MDWRCKSNNGCNCGDALCAEGAHCIHVEKCTEPIKLYLYLPILSIPTEDEL